jgi:hypothetical protein
MPTGAELFARTIVSLEVQRVFTLVGDHLNEVLAALDRAGVKACTTTGRQAPADTRQIGMGTAGTGHRACAAARKQFRFRSGRLNCQAALLITIV